MAKLSKEHIITTYITLLSKSPWAEVSISSIAKELGVTKPAIFHYFANKQALNDAAFSYVEDQLNSMAAAFILLDQKEAMFSGSCFMLKHLNECAFFLQFIISHKLAGSHFDSKPIFNKPKGQFIYGILCFLSQIGSQILSGRITKESQFKPYIDEIFRFFDEGFRFERKPIDLSRSVVKPEEIGESRYLKALYKVLHTSGMQSVNVNNFAEALGLAPSSLYSIFKDKKDMLEQIGVIEAGRLLSLIESRLSDGMDVPTLVETIIRTADSYFAIQVPPAQYIDALYVSLALRKGFEKYPHMLRAYDALEAICPGSGVFPITLPASRIIVHTEHPDWISLEMMIEYLYHGIRKENA